jgi:hypothetical protein
MNIFEIPGDISRIFSISNDFAANQAGLGGKSGPIVVLSVSCLNKNPELRLSSGFRVSEIRSLEAVVRLSSGVG